ncbi:MAG TPA: hypothetical protein VHG28_16625 [Longimicrobiaceae bacterium]|nr:hypothetical protein [Longimicrobiaceae bacterium]
MTNNRKKELTALGAALLLAGCQDLTVPNPNSPDIERILQDPADVESLVASSWRPYWTYTQSSIDASIAVSAMGEEMTATFTNGGVLDLGSEPRTAFNNDPAYAFRFVNQGPWYSWYGGINNANNGLRFVSGIGRPASRVVVDGVDRTARVRAFARFTQGLLHGYYAMYYDRSYVVGEGRDMADEAQVRELKLKPYAEVRDSAVAMLAEAAQLSSRAAPDTFTLPSTWINGLALRNTDLARLANSYAARTMVYSARTPQERAAVNWDRVIQLIDAGITADHAPIGEQTVLESGYKRYTQQSVNTAAGIRACEGGTVIQMRADYRIVGPADTTGGYQAWAARPVAQRTRFTLRTPDRRIEGAAAPVGGVPSNGSYFRFCTADTQFNVGRGTYHFSAYQWVRLGTRYREGPLPIVTVAEMNLLKAEGLLRKGDAAGAAALINRTRVANGQLPPLTASGVPQSRSCVPRTESGACGDLWEALYYEKGIEGMGIDPFVRWFDNRGWGRLPKGTPLHFPVPGRELFVIQEPMYTFGGSGPGSAP